MTKQEIEYTERTSKDDRRCDICGAYMEVCEEEWNESCSYWDIYFQCNNINHYKHKVLSDNNPNARN